jgi:16S rRNA (adenine1518-N6/adenine1519-N6)-dimethyltransferase
MQKLNSLPIPTPIKIIGNIPYNITSPILFWLIEQRAHWTAAFIMVQKEMADRLTGEVGTKSYGRLTVMIGAFLNVETLFTIPPDVFIPKPKVKSAIIKLVKRYDPLIEDKYFERFEKIVAAAFSRRRKMLRNTLSGLGVPEEIQKKIDFTRRPETLSISEFSELAKTI